MSKNDTLLEVRLIDFIVSQIDHFRSVKDWEQADKLRVGLEKLNVTVNNNKNAPSTWEYNKKIYQ